MVRRGDFTPAPPAKLHVTLTEIAKGQVLHRVHSQRYQVAQFNPGQHGNARFNPICNDAGQPIPTLYASTTLNCALMETIFHDVSHAAGFIYIRMDVLSIKQCQVKREVVISTPSTNNLTIGCQ